MGIYIYSYSLQSTPITVPLASAKKTYAITIMDNPGHIQFHDESVATMRLADGVIFVLDIIEGMTLHDELLLRQAAPWHSFAAIYVLDCNRDRLESNSFSKFTRRWI